MEEFFLLNFEAIYLINWW